MFVCMGIVSMLTYNMLWITIESFTIDVVRNEKKKNEPDWVILLAYTLFKTFIHWCSELFRIMNMDARRKCVHNRLGIPFSMLFIIYALSLGISIYRDIVHIVLYYTLYGTVLYIVYTV